MESMNKRCVFLEHAVGVTGLSNVQIVRGRAEVTFNDTLTFRYFFFVSLYIYQGTLNLEKIVS